MRPSSCLALHPHRARRGADGAKDPHMRSAAAKIALQRGGDLRVARVLLATEQRDRRDDDPVDAVPALDRLLVDESLLDRMQPRQATDPLDGRDLMSDRGPQRCIAGLDGIAIEKHVARAALSLAAAEARALELE